MKRYLTLLLTLVMILSLTACGSGSEIPQSADSSGSQTPAPEAQGTESGGQEMENPLEGTKFEMPGEYFGFEIKDVEVVKGTDADDFDKKITVYYASPQEAKNAYTAFWSYYNELPDPDGHRLSFSMDPEGMSDTADSFTFTLKYARVVSDGEIQQLVGKYYVKEIVGSDKNDILKQGWEDKSFYEYIAITEDKTCLLYVVTDGQRSAPNEFPLKNVIDSITLDGDELTMQYAQSIVIFERTDEIPDFDD